VCFYKICTKKQNQRFFGTVRANLNGSRSYMAAKPWEELHTQISTNDEYKKMIAYKGLTCTCSCPSLCCRSCPSRCAFLSRFPRQLCGAPDLGRAAGVAIAGMEVHAGWCGPSTAVVPTLKKLQWDMVEERRYRPRGTPRQWKCKKRP
jgi:hypothetical protein